MWLLAWMPVEAGPDAPVPLGRFAQPSLTGAGTLFNLNHNTIVERGFKLLYLAPQRCGERWGAPTFAGFFTVLLNGETAAYTLLDTAEKGSKTLLAAATLGRYAKDFAGDFGRVRLVCEEALGRPLVRLSAEMEAKGNPLRVEWLLTGYEWAGQTTPTHWEWWLNGDLSVLRPDGEGRLALPPGEGFLLAWNEGQPYTLALLPTTRPEQVVVEPSGVRFRFASSDVAPNSRGALPDFYAAALEAHPADSLLALLPALARAAQELDKELGWMRQEPFVRFRWRGNEPQAFLPIPPPFATRVKSAATQETPLGPVGFVPGNEVTIPLSIPPNLERLTETFTALPAEERTPVEADVKALLSHQKEDGQFTFSLGRPFYDGETVGVLIQLAPLLEEPLRGQVVGAVRKTLDFWWGRLRTDARTGVVHFPEPQMSSAVVDYPEISSTVLYPTAAFAQLVDRDYARQVWPKAAALAATMGRAYDVTGSAFAHAGPEYIHVLTESTVGGYLAYASLYHLAKLAGEAEAAADFRARACWAFAAMDLYRWREEYGRGGILAQIYGDGLVVEPSIAWDYTMFTWFSWCPLWSLPAGDPYHVFDVLKQQRWWLYFRDSRQLCYDFSHFLALIRFGDEAEGLAHWDEILRHEPAYENYDMTPLYRPLARAWKVKHLVSVAGKERK